MVRKITFVMLATVAILLLQFVDCMSAMTQDQQSMQCCGSMPCDRTNQSHECCKGMISSQSPSVLPAAYVTLHFPTMIVVHILSSQQVFAISEGARLDFAAAEHSPPELYTIHSSLLI